MKIALLGYGKMGKVIERIALERGHEIVLKKDESNTYDGLETADVAIDFSVPMIAVENISAGINLGIPVVSGTTGWLERYDEVVKLAQEKNGAFLYGSNFSLGVNLFFELNDYLAKMMARFSSVYKVSMEEIHHTQKLDSPREPQFHWPKALSKILPTTHGQKTKRQKTKFILMPKGLKTFREHTAFTTVLT